MRTFGAVAFGFIKPWNGFQIDRVGRFDLIQHILHAVVEAFRPEDLVIATTVHDERRDVPRHCGPVNVWIHRAAPANGITREQKETAEAGDLVKLLLAIFATNFDAVFLHKCRNQLAAIAVAIALNAANLVKKRRQNACVGIAHTCENVRAARLHIS